VGNLGVFPSGECARYQVVNTLPGERRQGVCRTLVYRTAQMTLADPVVKSLVMLADENDHAARIYEAIGFAPAERLGGLFLAPAV
jgi:predicted GNAT family acetyltransferase